MYNSCLTIIQFNYAFVIATFLLNNRIFPIVLFIEYNWNTIIICFTDHFHSKGELLKMCLRNGCNILAVGLAVAVDVKFNSNFVCIFVIIYSIHRCHYLFIGYQPTDRLFSLSAILLLFV